MMSGIRGVNTRPELLLRSILHRRGFRFVLHSRTLAGKPDVVLPRYRVALFVHGCFWHGHGCHLFRLPATRREFWKAKIERNRTKDEKALSQLLDEGWRVGTIWECTMRGRESMPDETLGDAVSEWLKSPDSLTLEVPARPSA